MEKLLSVLQQYDPLDLLPKLAALQLHPSNAGHLLRLELLSNLSAAIPKHGQQQCSIEDLDYICNELVLSETEVATQEDPIDTVFVEEVGFHGGGYLFLSGLTESIHNTIALLLKAIFLSSSTFPHPTFLTEAEGLTASCLNLSDYICRSSGLKRNAFPQKADRVQVPSLESLEFLKRTLLLSDSEFSGITALEENGLQILVMVKRLGSWSLNQCSDLSACPLTTHPIVQIGNKFCIATPANLIVALRSHILWKAESFAISEMLSRRLLDVLTDSIALNLGRISIHPIKKQVVSDEVTIANSRCLWLCFDEDKLIHLLIIADTCKSFSIMQPYGQWGQGDISTPLSACIKSARKTAQEHYPQVEVLNLVIYESLSRFALIGIKDDEELNKAPLLVLAHNEFSLIVDHSRNNGLALWQYANAIQRLLERAHTFSFGELDRYAVYIQNRSSFYLSDGARPAFIPFTPGSSGDLIRDVLAKVDRHFVPSHKSGSHTPVRRIEDDTGIPIYFNEYEAALCAAQCVDLPECAVWVVGEKWSKEHDCRGIIAVLVDLVAYWIWQTGRELRDVWLKLGQLSLSFCIHLKLIDHARWEKLEATLSKNKENPYAISFSQNPFCLNIAFTPASIGLFSGEHNQGERQFLIDLLSHIFLAVLPSGEELSPHNISRIVETCAPLGPKKKIMFFSGANAPTLTPTSLPSRRLLQDYNTEVLLDDIGEHLASLGYATGPLSRDSSLKVLAAAVSYLHEKLATTVGRLSSKRLLEWIVAHDERHIYDHDMNRIRMITVPACYASLESFLEKHAKGLGQTTSARIASRFLVEYISAQPPFGSERITLSKYDELLAICDLIGSFGLSSDFIYNDIVEIPMAILGSGRIGRNYDKIEEAQAILAGFHTREFYEDAEKRYAEHWRNRDNPLPQEHRQAHIWDDAFVQEFGITFLEFSEFVHSTHLMGRLEMPGTSVYTEDEFVDKIAVDLKWDKEKVTTLLRLLTLESYEKFLSPNPPFRKEDVYPWRFNRARSYLRRPFIVRLREGKREIVYGHRNVYLCWRYVQQLISTGRYHADGEKSARSSKMRGLIASNINKNGKVHEDQVYAKLVGREDWIIRKRISKFTRDLSLPAKLGDIDLLVAITTRKHLLLLECKNLNIGRTPRELRNEIESLFVDRGNQESACTKLKRRREWIEENLEKVLGSMNIPMDDQWRVDGAIVTSTKLVSPIMQESSFPVFTLHEIVEYLD